MQLLRSLLADYLHDEISFTEKPKFSEEELKENKVLMELDYPESDADKIADKCAFIGEFRDTGFAGNEPAWYAALGVVRHCRNGDAKCHEFSAKAEDYKEKLTNQKLYYLEQKDIQPTCCSTIEQYGFCKGCKCKVKSPIQLGVVVEPIAITEVEPEQKSRAKELIGLAPKEGWQIGRQGIFRLEEDETIFVTATPFFIVDVICESFEDETVITAIVRFARRGRCFNFRLSLKHLADQKKLEAEFSGRGIFVAERKYLKLYLIQYVSNLKDIEPHQVVNSMGWQPNGSFVYGSKGESCSSECNAITSIMDSKVINYTRGFETKGTVEDWMKLQDCFNSSDDFLPHVFSIMCAMGGPLLTFTAAKGILVSLQGDSGCGKTLAHKVAMSVWGNPETAGVLGTRDTHTAMLGRLGAVKNLPVRLDEATSIEPKKLSGLVFELVNGRGRSRATIDGSLSSTAAEWQTLSLVTTNRPLLESSLMHMSEAERYRILELEVKMPENMSVIGRAIGTIIEQNYGHAGQILIEVFIKYKEKVLELIDRYQTKFQKLVGEDKRFWVSCGAIAFTAATIANMGGLYKFDIKKLTDWFEKILQAQTQLNADFIEESRGFKEPTEFVSALKDWLTGSILVLNPDASVNISPVKEIKARIVRGLKGEMTLYVRAPILKEFIQIHYMKSFSSVKKDMQIKESALKRFGTDIVRCYEFKLENEK
jgi:hypothetical protein